MPASAIFALFVSFVLFNVLLWLPALIILLSFRRAVWWKRLPWGLMALIPGVLLYWTDQSGPVMEASISAAWLIYLAFRKWGGATRTIRHSRLTAALAFVLVVTLLGSLSRIIWVEYTYSPIADWPWPLDKQGNRHLLLRVPKIFFGTNAPSISWDRVIYGDEHRPPDEPLIETMSLTAEWPDLKPDQNSIRKAIRDKSRSVITARMTSGATAEWAGKRSNMLQSEFEMDVEYSAHDVCIQPTDYPDWMTSARPRQPHCLVRDYPDAKLPEYGLNRLGFDFSKYPDVPNATRKGQRANDLYYLNDDTGRLQTFISCTALERVEGKTEAPTMGWCRHYFLLAPTDSLVELSYGREYLKDWREMQDRWTQLIKSFVAPGGGSQSFP